MTRLGHLSAAISSRPYRALFAVFGGYAFTAGFFAFLSVLLALLGATRVEAMWWAVLSSFLVYTAVVIWVAATRRPWVTSLFIVAGALAMINGSPILAERLS
ncbi:MAG: hypothetical protein AAF515_10895 [Pseudomonadota bacterium]